MTTQPTTPFEWKPLTPELLFQIELGDHGSTFWLAARGMSTPAVGRYEWCQGRNPHCFICDSGHVFGSAEVTHVMTYNPPALP